MQYAKGGNQMTILVTGCAGFIGTNFVKYYLKKYPERKIIGLDKLTYAGNLENLKDILGDAKPEPFFYDRQLTTSNQQQNETGNYQLTTDNFIFIKGDICDSDLVNAIFEEYEIDGVINFAAESHVDRSIHDPQIFLKTNILGTQNLLDVAKKHWQAPDGRWRTIRFNSEERIVISKANRSHSKSSNQLSCQPAKFLQVSTDEVYGSLGPTGYFTEKTPLDPHSPYSASKASADLIVKAYHDTYGIPVNITRCSNNYGPYQFPEKLIPLVILKAMSHEPIPVYGDGRQIRDWLYVEDHCRAIDMVFEKGKIGEIYNIGGHNEKENIYIVKKIIEILREKTDDEKINESLIKHVRDRPGHDRRYGIDPTKAKNELSWEPSIMFDNGIEKTIDWYLKNTEWMQKVVSGEYARFYNKNYEI